jgi:hypothetical protein
MKQTVGDPAMFFEMLDSRLKGCVVGCVVLCCGLCATKFTHYRQRSGYHPADQLNQEEQERQRARSHQGAHLGRVSGRRCARLHCAEPWLRTEMRNGFPDARRAWAGQDAGLRERKSPRVRGIV